jgi:hypothetical protein
MKLTLQIAAGILIAGFLCSLLSWAVLAGAVAGVTETAENTLQQISHKKDSGYEAPGAAITRPPATSLSPNAQQPSRCEVINARGEHFYCDPTHATARH